jgi:putative inorganic carbon (hco3(-)) transporter
MPTLVLNNKKTLWWVYGCSLIFLVINTICIANEFYWLNLVPPIIFVVLLALLAIDKLILVAVFLTPLSINFASTENHLGLSLPVEPILAGILILFLLRIFHEQQFDKKFLRHPVTIAILFNLSWVLVTCITSELPIVSFKFLLSRLWFIIPFYFICTEMFKDISNVRKFLWAYIIPCIFVIGYTLYWHSQFSFGEDAAHWVMSPFYNDHTAYGAALAMFFPALIAFVFSKSYSNNIRIIALIILSVFTIALIFSYTRAAWVSLVGTLIVYLVFLSGIKFRTILVVGIIASASLFMAWGDIVMKLEKNRQDTSNNLEEHLQSISNISTDASNLERINRWNSAFRMFAERPIFGWGPGTYSFEYAPFQLSSEKTIISTNSGDLGNAHSEYIGPLSESGILGGVSFLLIFIAILWTGWRLWYKLPKGATRGLITAVFLGLLTYFIHGSMNNFLDTDKASVPFWGFAAILVAADLWYVKKGKNNAK